MTTKLPPTSGTDALPSAAATASTAAHTPLVAGVAQAVPLKYAKEIQGIASCPGSLPAPRDMVGFRFVFANIDNPKNFQPVALLQPQRVLKNGTPVTDCCSAYALSMFSSLEAMRQKVGIASESSRLLMKRIGDHFAQVEIRAPNGLCGVPDRRGHFDFFERSTFDGIAATITRGRIPL